MQLLTIVILIFIAIWAWPLTVTVLGIFIIYKIIASIANNSRDSKRQKAVLASAPTIRKSLTDDRTLLLSIIISTIKAHRSVLNDKFESSLDEDDYGNKFLLQGFGKEINYFSEKLVLPKLQHAVDTGLTKNKHIALILADVVHLPSDSEVFMSIVDFNREDKTVAEKLSEEASNNSPLDYELLYSLYESLTSIQQEWIATLKT